MTAGSTNPAGAADSGVLRLNRAMRPEARYKALVESLPDVLIVLFDTQLRVLAMEGGALERLPAPVSTYVGRRVDELFNPERQSEVEPCYRAALAGETADFDFDTADGTTWWTHVIPMVDDAGRVTGGMAKWRDVTPRKAAERALEQHALELERSNADLEQFAYVAAHDLSEPLRMVSGYLSLLERRHAEALDDDARELIVYAVDGAARMRGLINDLLAFSRAGRDDARTDAVDTQRLVEEAFRALTAGREGPEPTLLATGLPTVTGDPQQLEELFQHLVGNALKFVEPGRPAVVEVRARCLPDGAWRFVVEDDGIGLPPAQAERIFGIFQRLHTRDEFPGSGVGLAIARKVVERHSGRIWSEPRAGGGARFVFELPAAP